VIIIAGLSLLLDFLWLQKLLTMAQIDVTAAKEQILQSNIQIWVIIRFELAYYRSEKL
jgi:hypothetical protein